MIKHGDINELDCLALQYTVTCFLLRTFKIYDINNIHKYNASKRLDGSACFSEKLTVAHLFYVNRSFIMNIILRTSCYSLF